MNEQQEDPGQPLRIEAATFQVAVDDTVEQRPDPRLRMVVWSSVAAILAVVVVLVIVALPRWVATPGQPRAPLASSAPAATSGATAPAETADADEELADLGDAAEAPESPEPSADADTSAAQRSDTQARLRETLDKLTMLEALAAEDWAKSDLHALRERIAEGETAYREKRYVTAQNIYLDTAQAVDRLLALVPDIVAGLLDAGQLALDKGNSSEAKLAFEQALKLMPDNAAASAGLARAATLDQVLALVGQAEGYERLHETDKALAAYRQALAIDALAPGASAAVQRIERGQRDGSYRQAMSQGFDALEHDRFGAARSAFQRAAKLDGSRREVSDALKQVDNAEASFHIARQLELARQAEGAERWDDAVKAYAAALKHDGRLSPAIAGKTNAEIRARVDKALSTHLARTDRLADAQVHDEASRIVEQARALKASGKRLNQQIAALTQALELARTPLLVTLVSDQATTVTLYRVGELGLFAERELKLLPGRYTAIGRRDGYRDVRIEFDVKHGEPLSAVSVSCQEKLAFGN